MLGRFRCVDSQLSRNVAVCRLLRNVGIRSQIGNRSRFDRQTSVPGFPGNHRNARFVVSNMDHSADLLAS